MTVSCDKIRVKYRLKKHLDFYVPFDTYPKDYFLHYDAKGLSFDRSKPPIGKYVHSFWFQINGQESNIICFQGQICADGSVDPRVFVIEFNPNKHILPPFLVAFLRVTEAWASQILSADFCYDFKNVPVSEFVFDANGHCQTMTFGTVGGSSAKYLCPKAKDGRIKVYDKGVERKGKPDEEKYKNVSRVEISFKNLDFLLDCINFNDLQLWGEDLARIKGMLECLQRVKFPWILDGKDDSSFLNPGHLMAIRHFLDQGRQDLAKEYVRLSFSSRTPRTKYNDYIRNYNGLTCLYDGESYIRFADDLVCCIREALPNVS